MSSSFLSAQTHIVPEGFSGFTVSFKHDQNVDFFGEGKFLRDSYGNGIGLGYIYNGIFGIDLGYGYSLNNKKDVYTFTDVDGESSSEEESFNFIENFRSENPFVLSEYFKFASFLCPIWINTNAVVGFCILVINLTRNGL